MRLRKYLFVCALILVMLLMDLGHTIAQELDEVNRDTEIPATVNYSSGAPAKNVPAPVPTPLQTMRKDSFVLSAYKDIYHILSVENPCSLFFGGPSKAVEVLNGLFSELEATRMNDSKVGLSMYGPVRTVSSARTGVKYRLFEKAVINTNGPFYRGKFSSADGFVPGVGSFQPNTREARATILLHEMGHLIQGLDGRWLLPNDGTSDEQSRKNTTTIETRCGDQIRELQRGNAEQKSPAPEKRTSLKAQNEMK